jgi:hypothetical protein
VTTAFDEASPDGLPVELPFPAGWPQSAFAPALANSIIVKTGISKLFGFSVYSSNVAAQFILMFDANGVPAESTVPIMAFPVAATASVGTYYGTAGRSFDHGIVLCNSTTATSKTIGAADCFFDVQYV